jgi:acyl-CoA hydrolase
MATLAESCALGWIFDLHIASLVALVDEVYLVAHRTNREWVITLVIGGLTLLLPLRIGLIIQLLTEMNHQV